MRLSRSSSLRLRAERSSSFHTSSNYTFVTFFLRVWAAPCSIMASILSLASFSWVSLSLSSATSFSLAYWMAASSLSNFFMRSSLLEHSWQGSASFLAKYSSQKYLGSLDRQHGCSLPWRSWNASLPCASWIMQFTLDSLSKILFVFGLPSLLPSAPRLALSSPQSSTS